MNNAAVGTSVGGAGRPARMLALSAAVLVAVVLTLTAVLFMASPPGAPASSGVVGENPSAMGSGGEHYGEGWNNYGHNPSVVGAGGEHYGEGWTNYGR